MNRVTTLTSHFSTGLQICILFLVTGCLGIGGGDVQPVLFYTLDPVEIGTKDDVASGANVQIGLEKIVIPDYLNRKEIVVRTRHNELRYTGNHLWAERLGGSLPRVLVQNITRQMNEPAQVFALPWPDIAEPDLSVSIEVQAFEGQENPESKVLFELNWRIRSTPDGTVLKEGTHETSGTDWEPGNYSDLADRLSEELATAGRLIGSDVAEMYTLFVK